MLNPTSMPEVFPGHTVKTPAKTPTARAPGKTSSATPTPDNQPLQPSDGWATKSLQKPKPRGESRPLRSLEIPMVKAQGSPKNKVKAAGDKPKRRPLAALLSPVIATAAGRKLEEQVQVAI